jgi:hypothetical protein
MGDRVREQYPERFQIITSASLPPLADTNTAAHSLEQDGLIARIAGSRGELPHNAAPVPAKPVGTPQHAKGVQEHTSEP